MRRLMAVAGAGIVMSGSLLMAGTASAATGTAGAVPEARSEVTVAALPHCSATALIKRNGRYATLPVTTQGAGSVNCVMGQGAQGEHVRALQNALVNCHGLSTGGIDGIYGPSTRSAVRTLQSRVGVTVDGVYGPQTGERVSWRWTASGSAPLCARF
ncbi:peptidoglycan-binding protein [Streptomyces sp. NPDC057552]|uniref:peptidoglycan-binding domain-containing protein n=1 Tax=Streptomyces sp. NPDC057552 TaxID=3350537 RepID=UPI0036980DE4